VAEADADAEADLAVDSAGVVTGSAAAAATTVASPGGVKRPAPTEAAPAPGKKARAGKQALRAATDAVAKPPPLGVSSPPPQPAPPAPPSLGVNPPPLETRPPPMCDTYAEASLPLPLVSQPKKGKRAGAFRLEWTHPGVYTHRSLRWKRDDATPALAACKAPIHVRIKGATYFEFTTVDDDSQATGDEKLVAGKLYRFELTGHVGNPKGKKAGSEPPSKSSGWKTPVVVQQNRSYTLLRIFTIFYL